MWTGAGISSCLDLALGLVADDFGEMLAQKVARAKATTGSPTVTIAIGQRKKAAPEFAYSGVMTALRRSVAALPIVPRSVLLGAVFGGVVGAGVGLVVGLRAYAPTAWFAVIEVGLPAALCGALVGLAVGLLLVAGRRIH